MHTAVRGGLHGPKGGRRRAIAECACSVQGEGHIRLHIWGAAHLKHQAHVRDAGGVPAQWLVEGVRALPRVASRAHGAGRAAGREAGGGG